MQGEDKKQVHIRPFNAEDYEKGKDLMAQVHSLHVQGDPTLFRPATPESLSEYYPTFLNAAEQLSCVAEDSSGALVGLCLVNLHDHPEGHPLLADRRYAVIEALAVSEQYRRRGVGTKLIERVFKQANFMRLDGVDLSVASFNRSACAFYEKLGFRTRSYHMEYKFQSKQRRENNDSLR